MLIDSKYAGHFIKAEAYFDCSVFHTKVKFFASNCSILKKNELKLAEDESKN